MTIGITRKTADILALFQKNLVGRAEIVFLSFDTEIGSFLKFWTWYPALRKDRFFVSLLPKENSSNE